MKRQQTDVNRSRSKPTHYGTGTVLSLILAVAAWLYSQGVQAGIRAGRDPLSAAADWQTIRAAAWPPRLEMYPLLVGGMVLLIGLFLTLGGGGSHPTRQGAEEGSARWAPRAEINPYMARDNQYNLMLADGLGICTNAQRTGRNLNVTVIGSSGSGKTFRYVKPNLEMARPDNPMSFVITDPDGGTRRDLAGTLRRNGYYVQALDLSHMTRSAHFDPMDYVDPDNPEATILKLVDNFMSNTSGSRESQGKEDFWTKSERALLTALLSFEYFTSDKPTFLAAADYVLEMQAAERGEKAAEGRMDQRMGQARDYIARIKQLKSEGYTLTERAQAAIDGLEFALRQYSTYAKGAGETKKSIIISVAVRTAPLQINTVRRLMTDIPAGRDGQHQMTDDKGRPVLDADGRPQWEEDETWREEDHDLSLSTVGDRKTAIFLNLPDSDTTFNFVAAIMYQCLFQALTMRADAEKGGHLRYPVHMMLDEFANIGRIPDFEKLIAVIRKRWISVSVIVQNLAQLKAAYKDSWETIVGNCDTKLFLGGGEESTEKFISAQLGKETIAVRGSSTSSGMQSGHSVSWTAKGRSLLDEAEVGKIPDSKCVVMVRGLDPFLADKIKARDTAAGPVYTYTANRGGLRSEEARLPDTAR